MRLAAGKGEKRSEKMQNSPFPTNDATTGLSESIRLVMGLPLGSRGLSPGGLKAIGGGNTAEMAKNGRKSPKFFVESAANRLKSVASD